MAGGSAWRLGHALIPLVFLHVAGVGFVEPAREPGGRDGAWPQAARRAGRLALMQRC